MEMIPVVLTFCLALSLAGNGLLTYLLRTNKKKKPEPVPDITAQELLHDLTRQGSAVLRIQVLNTADILLRSPRGQ